MKKSFQIEVDCAVCAGKCEAAIKKVAGVVDCKINFIMQEMELDVAAGDFDAVLDECVKVAKRIEPDFEVVDEL